MNIPPERTGRMNASVVCGTRPPPPRSHPSLPCIHLFFVLVRPHSCTLPSGPELRRPSKQRSGSLRREVERARERVRVIDHLAVWVVHSRLRKKRSDDDADDGWWAGRCAFPRVAGEEDVHASADCPLELAQFYPPPLGLKRKKRSSEGQNRVSALMARI